MPYSRRNLFKIAIAGMMLDSGMAAGSGLAIPVNASGNFDYIYSNPGYRQEFKQFLQNVFNLYPENSFDEAIAAASETFPNDFQIYRSVQNMLPDLKPFFADLTYSLPALRKQKDILTQQSIQLIGAKRELDGYLEFGSNGRYLDELEEHLDIYGPRYFVHSRFAGYSPTDIIDRGQLPKAGLDIPLNNYETGLGRFIPSQSLDLVSVFIGFHHCPIDLRGEFVDSIRQALRPGGMLILRDHNVPDEKMNRMVGLAHDVFNLGTNESWAYNRNEFRSFYSLDYITGFLKSHGFRTDGHRLYQPGDPTHNALMIFRKA